jgi:hypothetical protein
LGAAALGLLSLGVTGSARAAQIWYHYTPAGASGTATSQSPVGPGGALATRVAWFGLYREPYNVPVRPTRMVTFRHPYTGRQVSVPLALPEGTPRIEHRGNRIIFNYGSYTVEARFLPDGSVDAIYNSGPFRTF